MQNDLHFHQKNIDNTDIFNINQITTEKENTLILKDLSYTYHLWVFWSSGCGSNTARLCLSRVPSWRWLGCAK